MSTSGMSWLAIRQPMPEPSTEETALELLDDLTDRTFMLYHRLLKGFNYDEELLIVKWTLEESIAFLKQIGKIREGCERCGSRQPETSHWHNAHCLADDPV